jgi:hypothetical protein
MPNSLDPLALARGDDAAIAAAFTDMGREAPSDFKTAADDAVAVAQVATQDAAAAVAESTTPEAEAVAAVPAAEGEKGETPQRDPETGKFVARTHKVKIADGDEVELTEQQIAALALADRNRPTWERGLLEQRQAIEREKAQIAQERALIQQAREKSAEADARIAEAQRVRDFVLYAEKERDAGRIASVAEFLESQAAKQSLPQAGAAPQAAAQSPALTPQQVRAMIAEDRANQRAEWDRRAQENEATRKSMLFDATVRESISRHDALKADTDIFEPAIGMAVAKELNDKGVNILTLEDAAMKALIDEHTLRMAARRKTSQIAAAGEAFEKHKGAALPAATPGKAAGTPMPTSSLSKGDPWSPENIKRTNDKFRGDPLKMFQALEREEQDFLKEMDRARAGRA